jgi:hypothetical protein
MILPVTKKYRLIRAQGFGNDFRFFAEFILSSAEGLRMTGRLVSNEARRLLSFAYPSQPFVRGKVSRRRVKDSRGSV